jgi:hypothetical protein
MCGVPARNYSWPPFAKNHELSARHGARSPRRVDPLASELVGQLLADDDVAYLPAARHGRLGSDAPGDLPSPRPRRCVPDDRPSHRYRLRTGPTRRRPGSACRQIRVGGESDADRAVRGDPESEATDPTARAISSAANPVAQAATITYDPYRTSVAGGAGRLGAGLGYHCAGQSVPNHIYDPLAELGRCRTSLRVT